MDRFCCGECGLTGTRWLKGPYINGLCAIERAAWEVVRTGIKRGLERLFEGVLRVFEG